MKDQNLSVEKSARVRVISGEDGILGRPGQTDNGERRAQLRDESKKIEEFGARGRPGGCIQARNSTTRKTSPPALTADSTLSLDMRCFFFPVIRVCASASRSAPCLATTAQNQV